MMILGWLGARWAAARVAGAAVNWVRLLPWVALLLGIAAALWAVERHGYARGAAHERPIAFAAGEKAERASWLAAQALATAEHKRIAKATEGRQAAVGVKVGETYATDVADLHAAYRGLRDASRRGSTRGADLPGVSGAAGGAAQSGGAYIVVTDPGQLDRAGFAPRLISIDDIDTTLVLLEEGDVYRLRVMAWVSWYDGVAAASVPAEN